MKKTPLHENHRRLGGKIIDFGGWALPVQYEGIIIEHNQVRKAAGLFDVSHMGEISVKGEDAEQFIQNLITNNILAVQNGQILYSPMCYSEGGVVDDLLVYKFNKDDFLLIVNAANIDKDFDWLTQHKNGRVEITNVSEDYAQLAIQGPKAEGILQKLTDTKLSDIKFYHFRANIVIGGQDAIVSRTGYTGEDGFEIYIAAQKASQLWDQILLAGKEEGLVPAGLGARDTLRFEAALPLYGHELSRDISPLEAGIGFFVKLDKEAFIGKEALAKQKEEGIKRKLIGFEMINSGIPRSRCDVQIKGESVGFVTSGSYAPSVGNTLGLALVNSEHAIVGVALDIIIRNKPMKARVIKKPFHTKKYKK